MSPSVTPREDRLDHSDRLEIMTRHTAGAAHDMTSLVTIIMGYGELIRRATVPGSNAHMNVGPIIQSAKQIGAITSRILAFCHGRLHVPEAVDLCAFFADYEVTFRDLLLNRAEFVVHCQGAPLAWIDPAFLFRLCSNLMVNARAALTATARPRIEISARREGDEVLLVISDNGAGMSDEIRQSILAGTVVSTKPGHTGLGTGVVRDVIAAAHGRLDIQSEIDVGTTYLIWLRIAKAGIAETAA